MSPRKNGPSLPLLYLLTALLWLVLNSLAGAAYPLHFNDDGGHPLTITKPPQRIVSLVPGVTEVIAALQADEKLVGITYHTTMPTRLQKRAAVVGGFFSPSLQRIKALTPDLVFIADRHNDLRPSLASKDCQVVEIDTTSLLDSYDNINIIGKITEKPEAAARLVEKIKKKLDIISRKIALIPLSERRRVMRLMGRSTIMSPGDNSFQNEMIAAAGGIPPKWGLDGAVVEIKQTAFQHFNPQFIYGCGGDRQLIKKLNETGWNQVEAVRNKAFQFFPCFLTCRAATHTGDFVSILAATIYPEQFSRRENLVLPEKVTAHHPIEIKLDYVTKAEVLESTILDFTHRTLVIKLAKPMPIISTLEGPLRGITMVGNHYLPPPSWNIVHMIGPEKFGQKVTTVLGYDNKTSSLLFTGADMRNLAVKHAGYKAMTVYAMVTAGVRSNAVRMGAETGRYYEPGTINIIIMSNMELSQRAMARAIISATEGKSAALQDLDIRSKSNPASLQATGTGTDNILVVSGQGQKIDNAGGHSKMGELIARTVYQGVMEAVDKQNGLWSKRSIFHRLKERNISIYTFLQDCRWESPNSNDELVGQFEELLFQPRYAVFMESALALTDAWERGQVENLDNFRNCSQMISAEIAGHSRKSFSCKYTGKTIPEPLEMALKALLNGLLNKQDTNG